MDDPVALPSSQLLAANRRLYELRVQAQAQRAGDLASNRQTGGKALHLQADEPLPWEDVSAPVRDLAAVIEAAPAHLGWGSESLTAVVRQRKQQKSGGVADEQDWLARLAAQTPTPSHQPPATNHQPPTDACVKLYPDIGLGMLRQEVTASGRLWLMLRYLDQQGSGQLRIDIIRQTLTTKTSTLRLCGKRQLRNLLRDGEGIFWTRDKKRVWLFSAARVAYALGVERLTGQPVALPVTALLEGIGRFRAHLYAAFHSGRIKETPYGIKAMPIARDTLAGL
ncbi:MAG TPA: hypothetical protein ENJ93_09785, partial [Chloroflexi bacterium]|nr:hypothetical protein [Chloroflexota bacterium]